MAEYSLKPRSIFDAVGGCRIKAKGVTFDEAPARTLVSLAASRGGGDALAAAVKKAFGLDLPGPGRTAEADGVLAMFSGPGQWLLSSDDADLLAKMLKAADGAGSVTDQSDAFTALILSGERSKDVLARLSSLDYDDAAFPTGAVGRTPMQQISVTVARTGDEPSYLLNTARSTARDFAHDVAVVVKALDARGG